MNHHPLHYKHKTHVITLIAQLVVGNAGKICFLFAFIIMIFGNLGPRRESLAFVMRLFVLPLTHTIAFPYKFIADSSSATSRYINLIARAKQVEKENIELKAIYNNAIRIKYENAELRRQLNFLSPKSTSFVTAQIKILPVNQEDRITMVGNFLNSGVRVGDAVVSSGALIGRVSAIISNNILTVAPINNIGVKTPVITENTRIQAIIRGDGSSVASSTLINFQPYRKNNLPELHESVYTTTDGDSLPPAILIGEVDSVSSSGSFTVAPARKWHSGEFASVIIDK